MQTKRALCIFIAAMLLIGLAHAQEPTFGGTIERPEFRGIQIGMQMPAVLIWEKEAGPDLMLSYPEEIDSLKELPADDSRSVKYTCEDASILNENVRLVYTFKYNGLTGASLRYRAPDADSATAYFSLLAVEMSACYGEYQVTSDGRKRTELFPGEEEQAAGLAKTIASLSGENDVRYLWTEPISPIGGAMETFAEHTVRIEDGDIIVAASVGNGSLFRKDLPEEYIDERYY